MAINLYGIFDDRGFKSDHRNLHYHVDSVKKFWSKAKGIDRSVKALGIKPRPVVMITNHGYIVDRKYEPRNFDIIEGVGMHLLDEFRGSKRIVELNIAQPGEAARKFLANTHYKNRRGFVEEIISILGGRGYPIEIEEMTERTTKRPEQIDIGDICSEIYLNHSTREGWRHPGEVYESVVRNISTVHNPPYANIDDFMTELGGKEEMHLVTLHHLDVLTRFPYIGAIVVNARNVSHQLRNLIDMMKGQVVPVFGNGYYMHDFKHQTA